MRIVLDTSLVNLLKEMIDEKEACLAGLRKKWKGMNEGVMDDLLSGKNVSVELINFFVSWESAKEEVSILKRDIKRMKFKLKEFYQNHNADGGTWDDQFEKAKSLDIRMVIGALFGISEFKYNVPCVLHKDSKPSMKIYDSSFYCFSCGKGGTVIDLIMHHKEIGFKEAVKFLADNF